MKKEDSVNAAALERGAEQALLRYVSDVERIDAPAAVAWLSDDPRFRYIDVEGKIHRLEETRANWSQVITTFQSMKYETKSLETRALAGDLALVFWNGDCHAVMKDGTPVDFRSIAWVALARRKPDSWKFEMFAESGVLPLAYKTA